MTNLVEATVENSLHLPDVATLTFHDPDGKWVDDANVAPGKGITISSKVGDTTHQLFDGEVVELESDFFPGERRVVVRAFDRLHRLARGRHVRSFVNMSDGDIINKIVQEVGLTAQLGPTPTVHPYVLQDNITNLEFLRGRAALLGYLLFVHGKTLHCEKYGSQTAVLSIKFGEDLREFHPRLTTVDQVSSADASGWDPAPGAGHHRPGAQRPTAHRASARAVRAAPSPSRRLQHRREHSGRRSTDSHPGHRRPTRAGVARSTRWTVHRSGGHHARQSAVAGGCVTST